MKDDKIKKPLSKSRFDQLKRGGETAVVKGTTDKIDKVGEVVEKTKIKDFVQKQKDHKGLSAIRDAAKKLKAAGQSDKADDLLKKAMQSDAAKRLAKSGAGSAVAKKIGKRLLSAVPLVGGIASALSSGDASAALPEGLQSESAGPERGSPEDKMEDPKTSPEQRKKLEEIIRKRSKKNWK